jgi:hypothetical protein
MAVNLPIIYRELRDARSMRRIVLISTAIGLVGLAAFAIEMELPEQVGLR